MRILLVEDSPELGIAIEEDLEARGQAVDRVEDLRSARLCLETTPYDLLLLDLMLPDGSGLDLLNELRASGQSVATLILTARSRVDERIAGLNAGADDYLIKPFDLEELHARIAAVTRRASGHASSCIEWGDLLIDQASRNLKRNGEPVHLTSREWALLDTFLRHPGQVLSRSRLEESLYAFGAEVESNTLEVYISRLRKKLGPQVIETRRGLGYRMAER
ncbi:response regulator transcription factor [Marinospirillum sp.]|uniref:response regulator transcription factor n=1 Tax=Marinospirillum sp. TaxID=2183934 RepID=UPI00384C283C